MKTTINMPDIEAVDFDLLSLLKEQGAAGWEVSGICEYVGGEITNAGQAMKAGVSGDLPNLQLLISMCKKGERTVEYKTEDLTLELELQGMTCMNFTCGNAPHKEVVERHGAAGWACVGAVNMPLVPDGSAGGSSVQRLYFANTHGVIDQRDGIQHTNFDA